MSIRGKSEGGAARGGMSIEQYTELVENFLFLKDKQAGFWPRDWAKKTVSGREIRYVYKQTDPLIPQPLPQFSVAEDGIRVYSPDDPSTPIKQILNPSDEGEVVKFLFSTKLPHGRIGRAVNAESRSKRKSEVEDWGRRAVERNHVDKVRACVTDENVKAFVHGITGAMRKVEKWPEPSSISGLGLDLRNDVKKRALKEIEQSLDFILFDKKPHAFTSFSSI